MIKFISYVRPAVSGQMKQIPVMRMPLTFGRHIHSKEELQQACILWAHFNLDFPEYRLHHSYSMRRFEDNEAHKMGVRVGFPDLWISLGEGKTGYVIFQYKQSVLTLEQENFRDFLKAEGHKWAICRSVEEFIQTLEKWGLKSKYKKKKQLEEFDLFQTPQLSKKEKIKSEKEK